MTWASCPLCSASLRFGGLEAHLREELDYARWRCRFCAVTFFAYAQARQHFDPDISSHPGRPLTLSEKIRKDQELRIKALLEGVREGLSRRPKEEDVTLVELDESRPDREGQQEVEEIELASVPAPAAELPAQTQYSKVPPAVEESPDSTLSWGQRRIVTPYPQRGTPRMQAEARPHHSQPAQVQPITEQQDAEEEEAIEKSRMPSPIGGEADIVAEETQESTQSTREADSVVLSSDEEEEPSSDDQSIPSGDEIVNETDSPESPQPTEDVPQPLEDAPQRLLEDVPSQSQLGPPAHASSPRPVAEASDEESDETLRHEEASERAQGNVTDSVIASEEEVEEDVEGAVPVVAPLVVQRPDSLDEETQNLEKIRASEEAEAEEPEIVAPVARAPPAGRTARFRCQLCLVEVSQATKQYHIATTHLDEPIFRCRLCGQPFFTILKTALSSHWKARHRGPTALPFERAFQDSRKALRPVAQKIHEVCFPKVPEAPNAAADPPGFKAPPPPLSKDLSVSIRSRKEPSEQPVFRRPTTRIANTSVASRLLGKAPEGRLLPQAPEGRLDGVPTPRMLARAHADRTSRSEVPAQVAQSQDSVQGSQSQAAETSSASAKDDGRRPKGRLACRLCNDGRLHVQFLKHAATEHSKEALFHCRLCSFATRSPHFQEMLSHFGRYHAGKEPVFVDRRPQVMPQLKTLLRICFR